ncbi:MAG: DUF362 domain-containing protein [Candidatus Omnitrophica bacterium]|nr:DUF362 domain-containing protein [Candidatus Omnitrophota bacterium]MBU1996979.1 DUF362 domain-containing protein [Candidatus Omnitrophota bacterium]MBU4333133.1 DUF362 domain-containing protein [Candidatus Omnitrophota bacterium]
MNNLLYKLETYLKRTVSRREFMKIIIGGLVYFLSENQFLKFAFAKNSDAKPRAKKSIACEHDLVAVKGSKSGKNVEKAIELLGGIDKFVKKGDVVLVKPNMAWDRSPEQAANTDPEVVATIVELCYKAGAKRVNIFDVPCNDDRRVYENSGIQKAAEEKGAKVYFADHWNVLKAKFPYKSAMEDWPIIRDAVVCDTFINVPVLKHHGLTGLTLSMKNLMGVCSGTRGFIHIDIAKKLVDLTDFINPDLTIIDATRVLTKNGPSGGNLKDVIKLDTVIASTDPTLADTYACKLMKKDPMSVPYLKEAAARKFGNSNLEKSDIKELSI